MIRGGYNVGPAALKELAGKLNHLLKIRSLPIGLKQYTSAEEMDSVQVLRRPTEGRAHKACQIVTQSRVAGFIITAMTDILSDEQQEKLKAGIPSGRMGTVDDIANACVYLASDEAGYVTGQTLHVNGGMAMI